MSSQKTEKEEIHQDMLLVTGTRDILKLPKESLEFDDSNNRVRDALFTTPPANSTLTYEELWKEKIKTKEDLESWRRKVVEKMNYVAWCKHLDEQAELLDAYYERTGR